MGMKQAMPSKKDREVVMRFLHNLDWVAESRIHPETEAEMSDEEVIDWLDDQWPAFGVSWQRVLYAGLCALDNACDPSLSYLEFKPELREPAKAAQLIDRIDQALRVPAVEYVPAIGDVFTLIDEFRKNAESETAGGEIRANER